MLLTHQFDRSIYLYCTRAIKNFCNSVWCTDDKGKTIASFFQYNLPSHQHNCDTGQKGPSFQSNKILETCCQYMTLWSAWTHHHRKTAFYKDASSDLKTEVVGCQVCWARWMRQLFTSDDLDYGSCNSRHVHRCAVTQQQWTSGQHSPPFLLDCLTQFRGSSHGCLMWKVIHQEHTCNPRKLWPWLFQPTAECESSWVEVSWHASSAMTPVC